MKRAIDIEKLVRDLRRPAGAEAHDRILTSLLGTLRQRAEPSASRPTLRRIIMTSPIAKLAVAAGVIGAVFIGISLWGGSLESVGWAEVAKHFDSVPFFHLTMYIGDDSSAETKKIEIWKSEDSRLRAHEGNKVFFADFTRKDKQIVVFDGTTRKPVEGGGNAPGFLAMLCKDGQFSLNTLTASLPSGVKGITPLTTADTAASRETVLFEARHETTPERLTIWALRASRLPFRMRFEDPRKAEFGDFVFDYSQKKDPAFFDPNAFTAGQDR